MPNNFKIMGVINVTPDSFSDGGKFLHHDSAVKQALRLVKQGAHIIDIGGESTRPGAKSVSIDEEINRVIPVISAIRKLNSEIVISIDTSKPQVMHAAIEAGSNFINDVNALQSDGAIKVAAQSGFPVCLMHKQGSPKNMQKQPKYDDVLMQVMDFFRQRVDNCLRLGITEENIILDPGIGFGKTLEHNLTLLRNIKQLKSLGFPILIGVSRKSMIGEILKAEVDNRLYGSLAIAQFAYAQGAQILRVHDVKATSDVLKVVSALQV
jgi:dihydropteroate synthase